MTPTPEEVEATMVANLEERAGKSMNQWLTLARKSGLSKHGEIVKHLKTEHELTHGYANLVAHYYLKSGASAQPDEELVAVQYSGKMSDLKPIYDALLAAATKLGKDVEVAPKKAYVSLRGTKQLALIQPSTATRLDLGLNLKGVAPEGRLEASGSFNSMLTHRVCLESVAEVDKAVRGWLEAAYRTG